MLTEQHVEIALTLYEARRRLRGILGTDYHDKIEPWVTFLNKKTKRGDVLKTGMQLVADLQANGRDGAVLWMLAAIVESIEPTPEE